jgi:hypothetical protein
MSTQPSGGQEVLVDLQARRFFCRNEARGKATFPEQVPGLTVRYARRTCGLQAVLQAVAPALGGRAGARRPAGSSPRPVTWPTATVQRSRRSPPAVPSSTPPVTWSASWRTCCCNRRGERLESWASRAEPGPVSELRSFARGLRTDRAAVTAGLTVSYSSGPVEGHVNRLR